MPPQSLFPGKRDGTSERERREGFGQIYCQAHPSCCADGFDHLRHHLLYHARRSRRPLQPGKGPERGYHQRAERPLRIGPSPGRAVYPVHDRRDPRGFRRLSEKRPRYLRHHQRVLPHLCAAGPLRHGGGAAAGHRLRKHGRPDGAGCRSGVPPTPATRCPSSPCRPIPWPTSPVFPKPACWTP